MTFAATDSLYVALAFYALGTIAALLSLLLRGKVAQHAGLILMSVGFVAHTIWIGTICARTGHPPLTNLSELSSFVAWTVFLVVLALWIRYRVYAASFFVYPLVLLLLTIAAISGEDFVSLDPALRSNIFTTHLLFSAVGVAALLIGLAFTLLAYLQDRSLKSKRRGQLWEWIPSLSVCKMVSYRALAIGFSIYTVGLVAGILWSWKTSAGLEVMRSKQIGAITAWVLFAILLQGFITGAPRTKRTLVLSAGAFIAVVIAILGIRA